MRTLPVSRRHSLIGLTAAAALVALPARVRGDETLELKPFKLVPDSPDDQSHAMQAALDAAVAQGRALTLPAGSFRVQNLDIPGFLRLRGVPGRTQLLAVSDAAIGRVSAVSDLVVEAIAFSGPDRTPSDDPHGLLEIDSVTGLTVRACSFADSPVNGIVATNAQATIEDCIFQNLDAAIHSFDGDTLMIRGNRVFDCRSAGIRLWRSAPGRDGSIVTGNRISRIAFAGGGNGQNGNGVSIFRADSVIVADNLIEDCAFSAVRVNAGNDTQIRGNTCRNSGEVAIFSEFGFSGSVIADNIVDGAATGISITNLDQNGHLATCTGNIVRNIAPRSEVNPDTRPVGIYAEADTTITGNSIDTVPGYGIVAGYGPFVRNVLVASNVVTNAETGIGISVVQEQSPGAVRVTGNIVARAAHGIVGLEWEKVVSTDLSSEAGRYPNVVVEGNTISS